MLPPTGETQPSGESGLLFRFFDVIPDKYTERIIFAIANVDSRTDEEAEKSTILSQTEHSFNLWTNGEGVIEGIGKIIAGVKRIAPVFVEYGIEGADCPRFEKDFTGCFTSFLIIDCNCVFRAAIL